MNDIVDDLFRRTSGHIVSTLTRILGARHLALAEEVAQDALVKALQTWPFDGVPDNPSAWLIQVAKRRAFDRLRRDQWLADRAPLLASVFAVGPEPGRSAPPDVRLRGEPAMPDDDRLAMMFLACHPSLPREARVALTLKTVCGFGVGEIARALLSSDDAIAQRLVRAKRQLRDENVAFELQPAEYAERLESVLDVLYLMFNEGYTAHAGENLIRAELCTEAVRLTSLLVPVTTVATPAVHALLALMLLQAARLPARVGDAANLLRIDEQDRARWDRSMIARGIDHLDRSAAGESVTSYHLEAGIAACHAAAARYEDTDWARIVELYDMLAAVNPTPVVRLNRAIAISRAGGAAAGLSALDDVIDQPALQRYYLLPATLGEFSRDLGDSARAAEHYRAALACECSEPERRFLERRLSELT